MIRRVHQFATPPNYLRRASRAQALSDADTIDQLPSGDAVGVGGAVVQSQPAATSSCTEADLEEEISATIAISVPVFITALVEYSLYLIVIAITGQLGAAELAATSLGFVWSNLTSNSWAQGFPTAIDTLGSQAYGAGNYERLGRLSQRGGAIMTTLCVPMAVLWWTGGDILTAMGQEESVTKHTTTFLRFQLLGLLPNMLLQVIKKYLANQELTAPTTTAAGTGMLATLLVAYPAIHTFDLGIAGAGITIGVSQLIMCLFLMWWAVRLERMRDNPQAWAHTLLDPKSGVSSLKWVLLQWREGGFGAAVTAFLNLGVQARHLEVRTWGGFSLKDSFSRWGEWLMMGLPGALMMSVEWGSFELGAVFAGLVGTTTLAAHTVLAMSAALQFMFVWGYAVAASVRTGIRLGNGDPGKSVMAMKVSVMCGYTTSLVLLMLLLPVSQWWARVFTQDAATVEMAGRYMVMGLMFHTFDGQQAVLSGAVRGIGRQTAGLIVFIVCYAGISTGISYTLAIVQEWGLPGIWTGTLTGAIVATTALNLLLAFSDWEGLSKLAITRAGTTTGAEPGAGGDGGEEASGDDDQGVGGTAPVAASAAGGAVVLAGAAGADEEERPSAGLLRHPDAAHAALGDDVSDEEPFGQAVPRRGQSSSPVVLELA